MRVLNQNMIMKNICKRKVIFGLLLVIALVPGCASSRYYAPGGKTALNVGMPAPGKSKVVFVRHERTLGKFINFSVHDQDRLIGILANSTYFAYECEPSHHLFSSSMENMAVLEEYLRRFGRPLEFYTDKASIFQTTPKKNHPVREEPLPPTQIGRALAELGIGWTGAHSPQATDGADGTFEVIHPPGAAMPKS